MQRGAVCLAALLSLLLADAARAQAASGRIHGRVALDLAGTRLADVGPVVVYLDGADGPLPVREGAIATVHQKDARFSPRFLAIAAGQSVTMANDDAIYHNVFSYSKPNDFDLGLYAAGQSRTVPFRHPGVVKTYCSIHESMSGTIFVAPSPWFAAVGADGRFELRDVPPGRYRLKTWCEKLPPTERTVTLGPGGELALDVPLLP